MSERTLIERLRGPVGPLMYQHNNGIELTLEAADRIERLEGVLREARGFLVFGKEPMLEIWEARGDCESYPELLGVIGRIDSELENCNDD